MARQGKARDTALELVRLLASASAPVSSGSDIGCGAGALSIPAGHDLRIHRAAFVWLVGDMLISCAAAARLAGDMAEHSRIMALHSTFTAAADALPVAAPVAADL
jgi:hypothetical protein